jgi:hypothetical protein
MTGRLAFNPGGNLPALLLIESGRLKAECGQTARVHSRRRASSSAMARIRLPSRPRLRSSGRKNRSTVKRPRYVRPSNPPATFLVSGSRRITSERPFTRPRATRQHPDGDEERRLSQGTALPEQQRVVGRDRVAGYPSPSFIAASVRGGMVTRWPRLSSKITPATLFRVVAAVDQP